MSILMAAILGLVQGIAEFLPISSSGHLSVLQNLFKVKSAGESDTFFNVLLHFATLISVCIVFRQDIMDMIKEVLGFFKDIRHPKPTEGPPKPARRLVLMIIFACLPLLIVYPFKDSIEKLNSNVLFIGFAFLFTGGMLFLSDKMKNGRKSEKNMTIANALIVGACQAIAVVPGISRSGATITSGMAVGLDRSFAVKFSFLISLPAILAATILDLFSAFGDGIDAKLIPAYLVGMAVAGVSGYFAIRLVRMLADKGKFGKFCYYCFAVGILTIILSFIL